MKRFKAICIGLFVCLLAGLPSACKDNKEKGDASDGYYNEMNGVNLDQPNGNLIENGKTVYKIVIPSSANKTEQYAADELKEYAYQSTGAEFEIVTDASGSLGDKLIGIGNTRFAAEAGLDCTALNQDGFRIKSEGNTVLIKGEIDRGTLYGVYHFLETFFGIRFVTGTVEYVPQKTSVPMYALDIIEIPDFMLRNHYTPTLVKNLDLNAKLRVTTPASLQGEAAEKYGGAYGDTWTGDMHSYNYLVPTWLYKETHPEWFTPSSGTGYDPNGQLHLSNGLKDDGTIDDEKQDSLIKHVIGEVKKRILANPQVVYVALGHNDNKDYCTGEGCGGACVRQRKLFGGHSAHEIVWVNAIAREITKWAKEENLNREFKFVFYAYEYTQTTPDPTAERYDLAQPDENVYAMLCPYNGTWYNAPINDQSKNSTFYSIFESWRKFTNRFFVFDYVTDFSNYMTWYPNLSVLKPNLDYYKEIGAIGVTSCAGDGSYQDWLQSWLLSKLMWHTNRDVNALISEFNRYLFGQEAGEVVDEYVAFNNAHFERMAYQTGRWQGLAIYGTAGYDWHINATTASVDYVRAAYRYTDRAREIIRNDNSIKDKERNIRLNNVTMLECAIDYLKYVNFDALWKTTPEKDMEFYRSFYEKIKLLGIEKMANEVYTKDVFAEMGIY